MTDEQNVLGVVVEELLKNYTLEEVIEFINHTANGVNEVNDRSFTDKVMPHVFTQSITPDEK